MATGFLPEHLVRPLPCHLPFISSTALARSGVQLPPQHCHVVLPAQILVGQDSVRVADELEKLVGCLALSGAAGFVWVVLQGEVPAQQTYRAQESILSQES